MLACSQVPLTSGSASQAQLLEARQLAKMRRFLTTIVQFGSDISPETGERVKTLVLALVVSSRVGERERNAISKLNCVFQSNSLGVEEFQRALQAAFNFPLRPFVLPFLRAGIPAMQREVAALARIAKLVYSIFTFCMRTSGKCRELSNFPEHARLSNLVAENLVRAR